jgi:hypothetical protein
MKEFIQDLIGAILVMALPFPLLWMAYIFS